jgi:farnesol dehydrogenase
MAILLTGATGYLGSGLAKRLADEGRDLVLYVRNPNRIPKISGKGRVEWIKGDLRDNASLRSAVKRCDTLIHTAALVKTWTRQRREFYETNVQVFRNLLNLAKEHNIKRFIYTSSFIVLGPSNGRVLTEQDRRQHLGFHNDYERTKTQAHQMALQAAQEGFPIVILYPGVIYGPGPATEGNLVGGLILKFLQGKLPGLVGDTQKKWSFAYIDDVIVGHLQALEKGQVGEGYILAGENLPLKEFLHQLSHLTGKPEPKLVIPYWLAWVIGRYQMVKANLTGITPQITHEVVGIYKHDWAYSSQKATQELGYRITPFSDGLKQTVEYYRSFVRKTFAT